MEVFDLPRGGSDTGPSGLARSLQGERVGSETSSVVVRSRLRRRLGSRITGRERRGLREMKADLRLLSARLVELERSRPLSAQPVGVYISLGVGIRTSICRTGVPSTAGTETRYMPAPAWSSTCERRAVTPASGQYRVLTHWRALGASRAVGARGSGESARSSSCRARAWARRRRSARARFDRRAPSQARRPIDRTS